MLLFFSSRLYAYEARCLLRIGATVKYIRSQKNGVTLGVVSLHLSASKLSA